MKRVSAKRPSTAEIHTCLLWIYARANKLSEDEAQNIVHLAPGVEEALEAASHEFKQANWILRHFHDARAAQVLPNILRGLFLTGVAKGAGDGFEF